ncbi:hypothetical protein MJG53_019268 [Ovis ammon polii x Ovis aries]|uniref:Uncharacterized protein n=1 Tax=Ovis ammon polii x Ovis aries TaxID=2918886 RepID=A0ACB9U304_9CETA|nr:hypothetical protein MJT46_019022 [Ovis ammon polii x Ovis aries]KAI4555578.1 hypothetical protein MJG53_019268 [Ovis ammon polii x Ovis aries]
MSFEQGGDQGGRGVGPRAVTELFIYEDQKMTEFKLSERLYYIIGFNYWHNTQVLDLTLWPTMRMSFSVRSPENGTSLVVQWLRLGAPNAGGTGSISGTGTLHQRSLYRNLCTQFLVQCLKTLLILELEQSFRKQSTALAITGKNWMVNKENKEYSKQKKEHEQERSKHEQTYLTIQKSRLLRTMEQIPLLINNKKSGNGYNIHGYSKDEKANTYIPIPVHSSRKGHTWTHSNPDDEVIVSTVQTGPTGVTQSRGSDIRILANFRESWLQAPSHRSGILVHRFSSENEAQDEVSQSGN